jgi:hypothetical protein
VPTSGDRGRATSFWGSPTYEPLDKDVARFLEAIRELTKDQGRAHKLKTATSAMHAICAFVERDFGPKEALTLIDKLKTDITG